MATNDQLMFPVTKGQFTAAQKAEDVIYTSKDCVVTPHGEFCMLYLHIAGRYYAGTLHYLKEQIDLEAVKELKVTAMSEMANVTLNNKLSAAA